MGRFLQMHLPTGYRAENNEGLTAAEHRCWQRGVCRIKGEVLLVCKEAQERATLKGCVIPDSALEDRVLAFKRVEQHGDGRCVGQV